MALMASENSSALFIPAWFLYRSLEMPKPEPARMLTDLPLGPTGNGAIPILKFSIPAFTEAMSLIRSQGPSMYMAPTPSSHCCTSQLVSGALEGGSGDSPALTGADVARQQAGQGRCVDVQLARSSSN